MGHSEKLSYSLENTVQLWENHDIYKEKAYEEASMANVELREGNPSGLLPSFPAGRGTAGGQRPLDYRKGGPSHSKLKPLLSLLHPRGIHPLGLFLLPPSKPRTPQTLASAISYQISHMDYSNTFLTCLPASPLMECSIVQSDFVQRDTHHANQHPPAGCPCSQASHLNRSARPSDPVIASQHCLSLPIALASILF